MEEPPRHVPRKACPAPEPDVVRLLPGEADEAQRALDQGIQVLLPPEPGERLVGLGSGRLSQCEGCQDLIFGGIFSSWWR